MIGTLGKKIIFEVSANKVLTFSKLERTAAGNWESHARIGQKPKSEFTGPALQSISMEITLDAALGVKPRATIDALVEMAETGDAEMLVIGNAPVSKNPWKITTMTDTWDTVFNGGELAKALLSLTLEEYV